MRVILLAAAIGLATLLPGSSWSGVVAPSCKLENKVNLCVVQFPLTISSNDSWEPFYETLRNLKKGDQMYIRSSGFGGNAYLMMKIASAMRASRGLVTMEVVGPVFSAHAFLTLAADRLIIRDYVFFMFHRLRRFAPNGIINISPAEFCRGSIQIDKCIKNSRAGLKANHDTLLSYGIKKIFTKEELELFLAGYDVYILGPDMIARLERLNNET